MPSNVTFVMASIQSFPSAATYARFLTESSSAPRIFFATGSPVKSADAYTPTTTSASVFVAGP